MSTVRAPLAIVCASALLVLAGAAPVPAMPAVGARPRPTGPGLAMMIVIDISGSMNKVHAGAVLMSTAREAAAKLVGAMDRSHFVGVLAGDVRSYLIFPLQHPVEGIEERTREFTAAGEGLYVYSALARAYAELEKADARTRHVVLLVDADNAEEMCQGLAYPPAEGCPEASPTAARLAARAKADSGVTLTVVALGAPDGGDVPALAKLAAAGEGRFYVAGKKR